MKNGLKGINMDTISPAHRKKVMSRILSKNTRPERLLRSALFKKGFRYRLHKKNLPGKPDIVFNKHKTAIFVHGCFWHLHSECREGRIPKSRLKYWKPKLLGNVERDKKHELALKGLGWNVLKVWECEIESDVNKVILRIETHLSNCQISS
jgi:DNA mismatch endonuclease (patch repair protein)